MCVRLHAKMMTIVSVNDVKNERMPQFDCNFSKINFVNLLIVPRSTHQYVNQFVFCAPPERVSEWQWPIVLTDVNVKFTIFHWCIATDRRPMLNELFNYKSIRCVNKLKIKQLKQKIETQQSQWKCWTMTSSYHKNLPEQINNRFYNSVIIRSIRSSIESICVVPLQWRTQSKLPLIYGWVDYIISLKFFWKYLKLPTVLFFFNSFDCYRFSVFFSALF